MERSQEGVGTMKIALIGYGNMGQRIEEAALFRGHTIAAKFSNSLGTLQERTNELSQANIAIDFSDASAVLAHLDLCLAHNIPLLIGTTGWEENLPAAKMSVEKAKGCCLYSPNFSLGVSLFHEIVAYAATLLQPFSEYDVAAFEMHHNKKKDAPSGTAKALRDTILKAMPRLNTLDIASVRAGHIPGIHTLLFDGPNDTITLTHEARNKRSFAEGAVIAAEWLISRKGFFTLQEMIKQVLREGACD